MKVSGYKQSRDKHWFLTTFMYSCMKDTEPAYLGSELGKVDGTRVGSSEGLWLGKPEGSMDGTVLGLAVGPSEGAKLGCVLNVDIEISIVFDANVSTIGIVEVNIIYINPETS